MSGSGPQYTLQGSGSDAVSGIYHYAAYYRVNGGLWREVARNQPNLSIPVTLSADSIYEFVSLAIDSAGNLEDRPPVPDFRWPVSTTVQQSFPAELKVFPNPASQIIHIQLNDEAIVQQIEIIDMQGRCVFSSRAEGPYTTLDIGNLPSGVYNLMILTVHKQILHTVIQKQ